MPRFFVVYESKVSVLKTKFLSVYLVKMFFDSPWIQDSVLQCILPVQCTLNNFKSVGNNNFQLFFAGCLKRIRTSRNRLCLFEEKICRKCSTRNNLETMRSGTYILTISFIVPHLFLFFVMDSFHVSLTKDGFWCSNSHLKKNISLRKTRPKLVSKTWGKYISLRIFPRFILIWTSLR